MSPELLPGNRLELLERGEAYFPALLAAIDAAEHEIFLETYIFENDSVGRTVATALSRAARRGVAVRVLVDGFGSPHFSRIFQLVLARDGVQAMVYRPEIARFRIRRHRLRRLHRKLAVIDGRIAFVGGINVIDDLNLPPGMAPRHDYAVRIEGPLLGPIRASARHLWELVVWANFRRRYRIHGDPPPRPGAAGTQHAAFLLRDNLRHRRDIEDAYLEALSGAREEILIANAYFLPGLRFRHALTEAARRGVRVVLLLQGRVEYRLQHYATQALYGSLLDAGVRIYEYRESYLHDKVAVIDGRWSTVGSSNIDPFSLLLAREANVVADDARFSGELRASLEGALQRGSEEILAADWKRKSILVRALHWLSYGAVRLLVGVTGYGSAQR